MNYLERAPSPHLVDYVKCYWSIEDPGTFAGEPEAIVPDGCFEIIFDLADRFKRLSFGEGEKLQPITIVAGQLRRSILIQPTGRIKLFGTRFQPAGAFPFFDFSLSELTDSTEEIDSIWGTEGRELEDRICEARTFDARVAIIEIALTRRLLAKERANTSAIAAAGMIVKAVGGVSIRSVAQAVGVSERTLEREFKSKIGVSPKLFARIIRFQTLLKAVESDDSTSLLDHALDLGYFDQAHMTNEFREFAGKSPTAYTADAHRMSDAFTGT